ncbi:hypothetical protein MtrunA17_Chr5g0446291 [Medicago truncatula]|uniref:Uncharacterized protein n=1 Tax=Medicago truncatula TaxID=3880 RepID=A0A396HX94_MEDTR|nr:hypothetical protein MtrunA17_Chr5g0446291 [Medicago truncatula]
MTPQNYVIILSFMKAVLHHKKQNQSVYGTPLFYLARMVGRDY